MGMGHGQFHRVHAFHDPEKSDCVKYFQIKSKLVSIWGSVRYENSWVFGVSLYYLDEHSGVGEGIIQHC